ncbi:hypothetical protein [Tabrizicola oligotrophica]|uniref:TIGR04255 family protein n=1 Tax=Tabrizicola oligotrophica TaxID=2710650 RepID=A0A6M0QR60_9RHOB|nr:hypothetical protein [Tabrizicola oligotrophica]NEY89143.1 hypothetical protein [Tabrizicola oligotrophica]
MEKFLIMNPKADLLSFRPDHPLFGSMLKVSRAERYIGEVQDAINAFFSRNPFEVVRNDNLQTGECFFSVRIREGVPAFLSGPIGDAIHNLRAAFDLLACQIVTLGAGDITKTQFPVFSTCELFKANHRRYIQGAPKLAVEIIEQFQPYYSASNAALWQIHKLDIIDKHRAIIPVGAAYGSFGFDVGAQMSDILGPQIKPPTIFLRPADRQFPLKDGAILLQTTISAMSSNIHGDIRFNFEIAFGEDDPVTGQPIIPVLRQLAQFTRNAIQRFADDIFV